MYRNRGPCIAGGLCIGKRKNTVRTAGGIGFISGRGGACGCTEERYLEQYTVLNIITEGGTEKFLRGRWCDAAEEIFGDGRSE